MPETQTQFAEEVLERACAIATCLWRENALDETQNGNLTVEMTAIVRSFKACVEHGLWNDAMASVTLDAWLELVAPARLFALEHDDVTKDAKALASIVGTFAVFFRDRMEPKEEAAEILPKAALHVAMAVLSIMKENQQIEAIRWAAQEAERLGMDADLCHMVARDVVAWASSADSQMTDVRLTRAGLSPAIQWVKQQCQSDVSAFYGCLVPSVSRDAQWLNEIGLASSDKTAARERLEAWFHASLKFPMRDQCALAARMRDSVHDIWMARMAAEPEFRDCDPERLEARMEAMALLENALVWLLSGQYGELDRVSTRDIPVDLMPVWYLIRALASMRQNLPWEDVFLRYPACTPPPLSFWPDVRSLYVTMRSLALCQKEAPQVALEELQIALEGELCDARICLAMAHAHTMMSHFGEAQQWMARADELDTAGAFASWRSRERGCLAKKALEAAKRAPATDASLLSLAMELGTGDVYVEAFLCWFDAGFDQFRELAERLKAHPIERRTILEALLMRDEIVRMDALYTLANELDALGERRDADILMAMACSDNPDDAFWRYERILEDWPQADRETNEKTFWRVASKYIELGATMLAFDPMTRLLAADFARDTSLSRSMFRLFLAHLPRTALMPVQQILMEVLGREAAVACLMRLKQPESAQEEPEKSVECVRPLPEIMGASVAWQILALAGNKLHPAVVAAPPSKHQIARTLMMKSREVMPEPPKAEWIHTKLGKASDAFDPPSSPN